MARDMHCFTETWDVARAALDLDFHISLSGIVTFKNALDVKDVARRVPLDRMARQFVLREIDAAAARILADIADDVGELERDSEVARVPSGIGVHVAEDFRSHQADDAGHAMAIALQIGKIDVAVALEVHGHAIDHCLEVSFR